MNRRGAGGRIAVIAATTVLVTVLATSVSPAAAQQTTTTTPQSTTPPATTGAGLTATSVRVGGLGWALAYGGADVGARARFGRANAAGGVNDRTIEYVGFHDDGGDPVASKAAAARLVAENVFAVVPAVTPALEPSDLVAANVPYFGWALSSDFCKSKVGFGFNGCVLPPAGSVTSGAWGQLVAEALGGSGLGKAAVVLTENTESGAYALRSLTADVEGAGFTVALGEQGLPVPAVGDYGGLANRVMTANAGKPPEVVFAVGSYSNVLLARTALNAAGYTGVFTDSIEYEPQRVASAAGAMVFLQTAPVESAATLPAMQQLVDDVRSVAPAQPIDQAVIAGYLSADLFVQVLGQRPRRLSSTTFIRAANRFVYDVPGVVGPTKFPKARTNPTPCGSLVQSDGVAFQVKVPYKCAKLVPVG